VRKFLFPFLRPFQEKKSLTAFEDLDLLLPDFERSPSDGRDDLSVSHGIPAEYFPRSSDSDLREVGYALHFGLDCPHVSAAALAGAVFRPCGASWVSSLSVRRSFRFFSSRL